MSRYSRIKLHDYKDNILLTGANGILIIPKRQLETKKGNVLVRKIISKKNIIYDGGPSYDEMDEPFIKKEIFEYSENSIKFTIAITDFINEKKNTYRYKLINFDDKFSDYTNSREVVYTNLKSGSYTLKVEGINLKE